MYFETEHALGQWDQFPVTVQIEYEKGVRANEYFEMETVVEVLNVIVTSWSGTDYDLDREGLEAIGDGTWVEALDRHAFRVVRDEIDSQGALYDQLCAFDDFEEEYGYIEDD